MFISSVLRGLGLECRDVGLGPVRVRLSRCF